MNPQTDEFNQKLINLPKLHQIINYSPLTISPNSYVTDAINLMNQQLNHPVAVNNFIRQANDYILVVEGKQLQGIFTILDVLRVIALNTNLSGLKMAEVMNQPLITLKQSDSAHILTVLALFQQHCIQHLPIVDDQDNLIGIVNKTNLLQSLNIEKMVGVVEALQENLEDLHTEHIPINQQLEVTRWQTHNYLQLWAKKQVADSTESDISDHKKLQATLHKDSDILENLVKERATELVIANEQLQQEIIKRKLLQKSLQESETRLTLALKASNIGIWDWHIQTNQTLWSSTMGLMYGLPLNTLCPDIEDFLNLIYPEDRQYYQNCLIQSLEERINFICEYRIVAHDNSLHWLSSRGEVYCNENGQPIRLIGTTRDISERKQTEQQISEQAALLEIATDGIFVRNFQAQILFWNQGAEKMYGWERQEVAGKNPKDIFYDSTSHEQEIIPLRTVVKSGSWQGELHKRTQSNKLIIVQSRWTLMLDDDGQPKSILTVDTDITEKKQLEEQFFRAQKLESISTLAGGIAHNINNNLTPILGYTQLLKSKSPLDKDNCLQMLTIIEDNAKKGASLVRQLLSFANKGVQIKYMIIQINDLIKNTIQVVKQTFSLPEAIEFFTYLPPKLWTINGDINQLEQVLINLIVNASHAMPHGGHLSISTENLYLNEEMSQINHDVTVGNYIVITVEDTGTGMSPKIVERVFDPFFTTKDIGEGTGLGLSTVLGTIKSHKGFIHVDSEVGKGSKFKIFLPSVNQEIISLEPDCGKLCPGQGELILVVDDEPEVLEVTKTILENYNYQTITAKNGMEAIAIYARYQNQIKVVLIDMMMPEMDGNSAICNLKKINPEVPIIACSGHNIRNMLKANHENQVLAILSKPYTNQELLSTLNWVLK